MAYSSILKPTDYFNTKLYTGNSSTNAQTGVGFQPDWTWIKTRNAAGYNHVAVDAVRGVTKEIRPNTNAAEITTTNSFTSFDSDGFTLGADSGDNYNKTGNTYASWNWRASGTSGSANTNGSISSTVSANTTSGFSIVKYVGTGSNATVGHGLSTAPTALFVKNLDSAEQWINYDVSNGPTKYYHLNLTDAAAVGSTIWNNTAPTTSVFSVGTVTNVNSNGANYVAYCFSNIAGFSKIGSYTGNGSVDGPFIYTGMSPAIIIAKKTSGVGDWIIWDNKRDGYNETFKRLYPNDTAAEESSTTQGVDFLSNGFKLKGTTSNAWNSGGDTYVFMAFAENPFVANVDGGLPTTAR